MVCSVKLISATQPFVEGVGSAEELVAYCARVSNPGNQLNHGTAEKLLAYCVRNSHWSVFEMADVTLEVVTTRDIGRQILRHSSMKFQEFSQRYSDVKEMGVSYREARMQDGKNRQNSVELDLDDPKDRELARWWHETQRGILTSALAGYRAAIDMGIAKEVARALLPEGMMESRMYMKGSLRSWIHYCDLRRGNGTQREHREVVLS